MKNFPARLAVIVFSALLISTPCSAGEARAPSSLEWEKTVEAAKKEGTLVAALPASAELRKAIGEIFPKRFPGIELDLTNARGPSNASKIAAEHAAGVRYFDLLISGTATPFSLLNAGILELVEPLLLLPEVKDPKRWFGGHVWLDNGKRFIYAFQVYQSENIWHNPTLMKVEDVRSYDDLLNPKWKGKIGILDPRSPGAGTATWAFFLKIKGDEYLKKLAAQEMFLSRPAGYERRHLHELRQQRSVRGQKLTASECDQNFYQLAPRQGRSRDLRQSDGTSDAPLRRRDQMDGRARRARVERFSDRRRKQPAGKLRRRHDQ